MFAAAPFLSSANVIQVAGTSRADVIEFGLASGGVKVTVNGVSTTVQARTTTRNVTVPGRATPVEVITVTTRIRVTGGSGDDLIRVVVSSPANSNGGAMTNAAPTPFLYRLSLFGGRGDDSLSGGDDADPARRWQG